MSDLFNLDNRGAFGIETKSNSQILMTNQEVESLHTKDPIRKTFFPNYLYKPPFGYPRNVNVVFLRELAKNPYVFSVIKAITDQAAEAEWEIVCKEGVEVSDQIQKDINFNKEWFANPNSDNESFSQLLRKIIPDILVLDSGCFVKVYNKKGDLVELRAIDGGAILKNPDRHGSLSSRTDVILDDAYFGMGAGKGYDVQKQVYKKALEQYNNYGYTEQAAYFQFTYGINYSIPIPYGKKEIIYMMENPASETVYSRSAALESAVDITLNLIYSSKASLDLFLNANIPTGIIQLAEASNEDTQAFQDMFYNKQYSGYDEYGFQRKINGKMPVVGNPNVNFIPLSFKSNESEILQVQQWFTKVLWSCFGVTADEMGFTETSNKAVSEQQTKANARKAVQPRLDLVSAYINDQIMPELRSGNLLEFRFKKHDIEEENKKWEMYERKINMGVLSPKQVAEIEGIDYEEPIPQENNEEELKAMKNPCQPGYEMYGTKKKNGRTVPNCVPIKSDEDSELKAFDDEEGEEVDIKGEKKTLNKPFRLPSGSSKKFGVYVRDGDKIKKVTFGDPNMEIRRDNKEARDSFRARHNCAEATDKTSAKYWSCKMWSKTPVSKVESKSQDIEVLNNEISELKSMLKEALQNKESVEYKSELDNLEFNELIDVSDLEEAINKENANK